ncbi:TRAP transporter small permease [Pararhodobacter sp.]|uniref:TRAP transporter small permease n=1 Tax=Pararhodobacter sp. TaxID=2127056 RepID=UPI002AFFD5EF|nr:TRAP transporter small permease [Pararhodobacter sp.]
MKTLVAVVRAIETGLRAIAALCLAGMFALMLAQVILRYTAVGVPAFTEEVARYAMIWMAMLASAVAVREGSHIRIDFVPVILRMTAPRLGIALQFLLDVLLLGIFLVILWQGLDVVAYAASQRSDGLRIALSWPYAILPIAFGLSALFALARLIAGERLE